MMMPKNEGTDDPRQSIRQKGYRYILTCCSICTSAIWFRPIEIKEPVEAPEPRHEWLLCKSCYEALLVEMRRAALRSSIRLRIAIGLVAAERSPRIYDMSQDGDEQQAFQREFAWGLRFLVFFGLLHMVIFFIFFTVPR